MHSEPVAVDQPAHPLGALTSYELREYRQRIEGAIKGISPDAPIQADLRRKLAELEAETAERERIRRNG
jgi:hypothetical protein